MGQPSRHSARGNQDAILFSTANAGETGKKGAALIAEGRKSKDAAEKAQGPRFLAPK